MLINPVMGLLLKGLVDDFGTRNVHLPCLLACAVEKVDERLDQLELLHLRCANLRQICKVLGANFSRTVVKNPNMRLFDHPTLK